MNFHKNRTFESIGLEEIRNLIPWALINNFVWYSRSHIDAYNSSKGVKNGHWQTYNASRGIATYRMAQVLGLEAIIPATYYVSLNVAGSGIKFGSFMETAKGIHYDEYSHFEKNRVITPQMQRALLNLNILDVITYEKDHRLDNYNIVFDDSGKAVNVCAYDNDSGPCFFISTSPSFITYAGCQPILKSGLINRPHLPKSTADKILYVSKKEVYSALDGYCNTLQKWACWQRLKCIIKAIKKTSAARPDFLLNDSSWTDATLARELSGQYGKTYLCLLNDLFEK